MNCIYKINYSIFIRKKSMILIEIYYTKKKIVYSILKIFKLKSKLDLKCYDKLIKFINKTKLELFIHYNSDK